jgi:hypothetical protein
MQNAPYAASEITPTLLHEYCMLMQQCRVTGDTMMLQWSRIYAGAW